MIRKLGFLAVLFLSACGYPQPNAQVKNPDVVTVGKSVALDASGSYLDRDSTYTWTLDKAPYGSTAAIDNQHAKVTSITPDLPGQYQATITIANKVWSDSQTITITAIPELADGVTEVGVLVIHNQDTILGWQIGHTIDEAGTIIALQYPSLVTGWGDGSVKADIVNVPIADTSHPELYQVVDWNVELIPDQST